MTVGSPTPWRWIIWIVAIGTVLRVIPIETAISWDEAIIFFWLIENPFSWILSYYQNVGNHVLLTILTAWSYYLFGPSLWAIRIPSLIAGIALIPGTYLLARCTTNERTAKLAAGIVVGLNFLILYSVNERGYGLQATLVVFMLWSWFRCLESHGSWRHVALTALLLTAALYTIPTTLFVVPALGLITLIAKPGVKELGFKKALWYSALPVSIAGCFTFLLYLPILLAEGMGGTLNNSYLKARLPFKESFNELVVLSKQLWQQSQWGVPPFVSTLVAVLILVGLARSLITRCSIGWVLVGTAMAIVAALLGFQPAPVRAFVFFVPLGAILLAYGFDLFIPRAGMANAVFSSSIFSIVVAVLFGVTSLTNEEVFRESSKDYGRERGSDILVSAMAPLLQPGDYVEHVIPQMAYWMHRFSLPRFPEFYEAGFLNNGKRIFVVVRHLRESLERVIQVTPLGQIKELSLSQFSAPVYVGRYGDFDLYRYDRLQ